MYSSQKYFRNNKTLPVDKFFKNVLYDKKFGYYASKNPFGKNGDFITAPKISNLFSEILAIWIISAWENFGKPKNLDIIELGPGDGSLMKVLLSIFKKFPEFDVAKNNYMYETSVKLKKKKQTVFKNKKIKWIKNFKKIKKGPVIFFGNEFFDAIPIKQFKRTNKDLFEKNYILEKSFKVGEIYKSVSLKQKKKINEFDTLKKLKFIEFPKLGLVELKKISDKISELNGCFLMIDYGYTKPNNQDTLQSVIKHKKNAVLKNLGKADVTSHVNFTLIKEFFLKNNLMVKKIVTQREFLQNMGIIQRAEILSKKLKFTEKSDMYYRLKRLLSPKSMGDLFKVFLAYNFKNNNFYGFN